MQCDKGKLENDLLVFKKQLMNIEVYLERKISMKDLSTCMVQLKIPKRSHMDSWKKP